MLPRDDRAAVQHLRVCALADDHQRTGQPRLLHAVFSAAAEIDAPDDARQTYALDSKPVSRSYVSFTRRANSCARSARVSATAHPPNPAPVIRAPKHPFCARAMAVMRSSAGDDTSKSSRRLKW